MDVVPRAILGTPRRANATRSVQEREGLGVSPVRSTCTLVARRNNIGVWDLWPKVIAELHAKGIHAGPESFKRWNDGDAGFVRAIWCLVAACGPGTLSKPALLMASRHVSFLKRSRKMVTAISGVLIGLQGSVSGKPKLGWLLMVSINGPTSLVRAGDAYPACFVSSARSTFSCMTACTVHAMSALRWIWRGQQRLRPRRRTIVVDDIDVNRGFHTFTQSFSGYDSMVCIRLSHCALI